MPLLRHFHEDIVRRVAAHKCADGSHMVSAVTDGKKVYIWKRLNGQADFVHLRTLVGKKQPTVAVVTDEAVVYGDKLGSVWGSSLMNTSAPEIFLLQHTTSLLRTLRCLFQSVIFFSVPIEMKGSSIAISVQRRCARSILPRP